MPYRDTATGLASLGRHGDDTLVHMGRDEVEGLQALAMAQGGSLSINPYTGMPEAFDLKGAFKKFLPTIIGAAGYAMGLGPAGQMLAGGLAGAATSKGNLLKGFAMGALGGYGGGGLAKGFMGAAGTAGATGATGAEAATAGADVGAGAGGTGVGGMAAGESARVAREVAAAGGAGGAGAAAPGSLYGAASAGPPGALQSFDKFAGNLGGQLPQGAQDMIANQSFGKSGIAALASGASRTPTPKMPDQGPLYRQYDYDNETGEYTALEPSDEYKDPYAPGGLAYGASGGAINDIATQNNYLASLSKGGSGDTDIDGFTGEARYAYGGDTGIDEFTGEDQYAYGGPMGFQAPVKRKKPRKQYLQGPGDGVSDSIPAVIETGKRPRPARLAAGEFIVPARVVAEIGNGSSDAGSKQLYAMLDRIESRMKKSKRGKDSGARGELPA